MDITPIPGEARHIRFSTPRVEVSPGKYIEGHFKQYDGLCVFWGHERGPFPWKTTHGERWFELMSEEQWFITENHEVFFGYLRAFEPVKKFFDRTDYELDFCVIQEPKGNDWIDYDAEDPQILVCTCKNCPSPCTGRCGCEACHRAYMEHLSGPGDF